MRVVRSLVAGHVGFALLFGCVFLTAGCEGDTSKGDGKTVKDAPLPPDQQKTFDQFYKNPNKKAAEKPESK